MRLRAAALLLSVSLAGIPACAAPVPRSLTVDAPRDQPRVYLDVRGMTCPVRCPEEVRTQLRAAPGVTAVAIDYDSSTALCAVRQGTDPLSVAAALRDPYSARVLAR